MAPRALHPVLTAIVVMTVLLLPAGCGFGNPGPSASGGDSPVVNHPGRGDADDPGGSGPPPARGPVAGCVDPSDVMAGAPARRIDAARASGRTQVVPPCAPVEVPPPFTVPKDPSPGRVGAI